MALARRFSRRLFTKVPAAILAACGLGVPTTLNAQAPPDSASVSQAQGAFPDASFETILRKYTPPASVYSPYYSWDAHMAFDLTVYRGTDAATFRTMFQSVGTESFGSRVGVGGTGYIIRFGYTHTRSDGVTFGAGISHLSSHLTRDLDEKLDEARANGTPIPVVSDPSQYNVPYVEVSRKLTKLRFSPEFLCILTPLNLNLAGGLLGYVRPLYVRTRWALWRGHEKSIVAETQHEVGKNAFNHFALLYELHQRDQDEGRFQLFISGSPGSDMHVSPHIGGLRDGISFGVRMKVRE